VCSPYSKVRALPFAVYCAEVRHRLLNARLPKNRPRMVRASESVALGLADT
jgi:hypothetical protein